MIPRFMALALVVTTIGANASAQTRDEMVREDRRKVTEDGFWIYNDLDKAFREAEESGKPVLVVLRCIPCHECVKLDDDLVDKHPVIRPLLDKFVCVRQVSTNGLDLNLFQYDTDQSFAVFMLSPDKTIYGRFGTRSHRTEWLTDVSLDGLAKALQRALDLHAGYPGNKAQFARKHGRKPEFASPELFPSLKEKFTDALNYEGDVAKSCIHCHQIGEAQREYYWRSGEPIPESVLFPYPHPKSIGLVLDPNECATVKSVTKGSPAAESGLEAGDVIASMNGQPLLSMADVQWVLHQTDPSGGQVSAQVERRGRKLAFVIELPSGWRQADDLSWRVTSWSMRRIALGGMVLNPLGPEARERLGLRPEKMALEVTSAGKYGAHATARRAGLRPGDVVVSYDGRDDFIREQELFRHTLNERRPGDQMAVRVRRGDQLLDFKIPAQP